MKFKAKPGQIDFSKARWTPVVNCVVKYKDKILLVQRSRETDKYPGFWNGVSGYLDDRMSLEQKALVELKEEIGMPKSAVRKIKLGQIFDQEAPEYKKTWIVHPILVEVSSNKVRLDWEAQDYKWVLPRYATRLKLLPNFKQVLVNLKLI